MKSVGQAFLFADLNVRIGKSCWRNGVLSTRTRLAESIASALLAHV